jgi:hypothetical protein
MKKVAAIIMLLALVLSIFTGCFFRPKLPNLPSNDDQQDQNDDSNADDNQADIDINTDEGNNEEANSDDGYTDENDPYASLVDPKNPSEGFANYSTVKGEAINRISAASESSDTLSMTVAMNLLGISMIDLSLISLSVLTDDIAASQTALSWFGLADVKISGSGNNYTITYTDSDGASIKQTCEYDVSKDQMSSTLYGADGEVSIYFEYVHVGDAYAAQYYYDSDGSFELIRTYFDMDNVAAIGSATSAGKPESILGGSVLDENFAVNDESYMILKDGKLTVFDQGTEITN